MGDLTSYSRQPWGSQLSRIPDTGKERQAPKNALALAQELDNADKKAPDPLDVFSGDEDMKDLEGPRRHSRLDVSLQVSVGHGDASRT